MNRRINLYVKCGILLLFTFYLVNVTFAFVIHKAVQKLRGKANTTETIKNRSLDVETQTTTIKISSQEYISNTTSTESQAIKDLIACDSDVNDTETDVNLDHVRKKLNDEDLYEHVTDKNNVSQRSFVFIPASKYKIPVLNPLARPQKIVQSAYEKTFISNMDDFDIEPFDDFSLRYDGFTGKKPDSFMKGMVADAKPTKKVSVLDNPFYNSILGSPIEKEMDSLTNKVKAANGIIHMQYNNVNNDLLHIERQFPVIKNDKQKGLFKNAEIKMFGFSKPLMNTHDYQINNALFDVGDNRLDTNTDTDLTAKQRNEDTIDGNVTGANANDFHVMGDRYDYVELIKQALLRPVEKHKPGGNKNTLYNSLKLDLPFHPNPYKNDHLNLGVKGYTNLLSEPYKSRQFGNLKISDNLNSHLIDSGFDNQNPSDMLFNNLIKSEPLDSNPFRKDINSSNKKAQALKSEHNHLNMSYPPIPKSGKPVINFQSQNFDFNLYGHNSRSATIGKQSSASSLDASSPEPRNKSNLRQPYQTKWFGHDSLISKSKSQNNFKLKLSDSKPIGNKMYSKSNHYLNQPVQQQSPYQQEYINNMVQYRVGNKLKSQQIMPTNRVDQSSKQTENDAVIKHLQLYPEDNEEPDFHNSLLEKKVQEITELGKQFNDDSTSREIDSTREIDTNKYLKTQEQNNRIVKSRPTIARNDCVYPDCEVRQKQHKNFKKKPHKDKCDCDVKKRAPKVEMSHSAQITPVVINTSTDVEVK